MLGTPGYRSHGLVSSAAFCSRLLRSPPAPDDTITFGVSSKALRNAAVCRHACVHARDDTLTHIPPSASPSLQRPYCENIPTTASTAVVFRPPVGSVWASTCSIRRVYSGCTLHIMGCCSLFAPLMIAAYFSNRCCASRCLWHRTQLHCSHASHLGVTFRAFCISCVIMAFAATSESTRLPAQRPTMAQLFSHGPPQQRHVSCLPVFAGEWSQSL